MFRWFGHVERMDDSRLVKRMYSGERAGKRPVGRPKEKWIESVRVLEVEECEFGRGEKKGA